MRTGPCLLLAMALGCAPARPRGDDDDSGDDDDDSGDDDDGADDDDSGASDDDDAGDDDDDSSEEVPFRLWSDEFISDDGISHSYVCDQALPIEHACGSPNPAIRWEGAPPGTASFVLVFEDVSFNDYPHWAIFNIPGNADGLDAGISGQGSSGSLPKGATELDNANFDGYLGSCPANVNHYRWRLWALDATLDASVYVAMNDDPWAAYAALALGADVAALATAEMCHVFDGAAL